MASYKIILACIYFPLATIIYTIILLFGLHYFAGVDFDHCKKLCLLMPLFIPIYAFVEVKTYDSFSRHWIKLNYLFIRIFRNDVYEKYDKWKA